MRILSLIHGKRKSKPPHHHGPSSDLQRDATEYQRNAKRRATWYLKKAAYDYAALYGRAPCWSARRRSVSASDLKTRGEFALTPITLGTVTATLLPHHIETVGARVFFIVDEPGVHWTFNLTVENVRLLANCLTISANEAEALARKAHRRRA